LWVVVEVCVEAGALTNGVLQVVELLGQTVSGVDELATLR